MSSGEFHSFPEGPDLAEPQYTLREDQLGSQVGMTVVELILLLEVSVS